jgi:hypothetical protein
MIMVVELGGQPWHSITPLVKINNERQHAQFYHSSYIKTCKMER